jgi:thiol-disulfide isomerase/thioredoxin
MRNNTPVDNLLVLIVILALATGYGFYFRARTGRLKATTKKGSTAATSVITAGEMGAEFGSVATLLQFSSAFCAPCRTTKVLLSEVAKAEEGVAHVVLDAESHLELVRRLKIISTPTTLILDSNGVEVGRAVGAPRREQVAAALHALR